VEDQCRFVPTSALVNGRSVFILVTSALIALKLLDVENSSLAEDDISVWAASTMISFGCALVFLKRIHNNYITHMNSKTSRAGSGAVEQVETAIEMTTVNKASTNELEESTTRNPIRDSV